MTNLLPARSSDAPDRLGRYRLIAKLGEGGMGTIHLAVTTGLGGFRKLFVLKVLKEELASSDSFLEMFMREARVAARLNHPNVVHTIEADCDEGRFYLAMEFLDGQPLNTILRRAASAPEVPLPFRLQVLCHALSGLQHAHELRDYNGRLLQVIHRDVSPSNIFVTYDGQVKVLDFGIAKASDRDGTQPGAFKGKISYAAPEQLRSLPADPRVDVFAAGVVLWETITLRHLVHNRLSRRAFEARLTGTEPRVTELVPDVDPELAAICERAMFVDRERRYPTAEAFRDHLQSYLLDRKLALSPGMIAQIMHAKFADERLALHRLIEEQLQSFWSPDPITTTHARHSVALGAEWPAAVSGELNHAARLPPSSEFSGAPFATPSRPGRERSLVKRGLLLSACMLVALAIHYQLRERAQPTQHTAPAAGAGQPHHSARPPASIPSPEPRFAATPSVPTPPEPKAAPVTSKVRPSLAPSAVDTGRPKARNARTPSRVGVTPPNPRVPPPEPNAILVEEAPQSPKVDTKPSRAASPPRPLEVDLHKIDRPARRRLDLDNPFE